MSPRGAYLQSEPDDFKLSRIVCKGCEHTVDVDPGVAYLSLVEPQCYCGQVVHVFVAKLEISRGVSSLALRHFVTTLYEIRDLKPDITKRIRLLSIVDLESEETEKTRSKPIFTIIRRDKIIPNQFVNELLNLKRLPLIYDCVKLLNFHLRHCILK